MNNYITMEVDIETLVRDTAKEYDYLENNMKKLEKYAGKWVAVLDEKVVCSGKDFAKVMNSVEKSHPGRIPVVMKIFEKDFVWV